MISINTPVVIKDKPYVFIRDVMGSAASEKYTKQAQSGQSVWYEEDVLVQVREAHDGIPVYGLWQTLLASGLIDANESFQVVFTSADKRAGYYLFIHEGRYQTGTIFNGAPQALPSAATEQGLTLADGKEIDIDLQSIKLPDSPLLTQKERRQAQQTRQKAEQQKNTLVVALIAGLAVAADTGLGYLHGSHMEKYELQNAVLAGKQDELKSLTQRKLIRYPNQEEMLNIIYQIGVDLEGEKVAGKIEAHRSNAAVLIVENTPENEARLLSLESKGIEVRQNSPSETEIIWSSHAEF